MNLKSLKILGLSVLTLLGLGVAVGLALSQPQLVQARAVRNAARRSVAAPSAVEPNAISLVTFTTGLNLPVSIAHANDSRLFVVQQSGQIRVIAPNGTLTPTPFLDISDRITDTYYEQGLLGLAFDPAYASNGHFYVHYTHRDSGDIKISRFSVTSNPNVADPNSEVNLLTIPHATYQNHNGGDLHFGPDGYLYIAVGDGGSSNDPENNAQRLDTWLGKILRVHVSNQVTYTVPASNPFTQTANARPEIWAFGLRNPWRFSFDRATGHMYIADVGQGVYEELDFQPAGVGGQNYGWRCYEGPIPTPDVNPCPSPTITYTPPVAWYDHSVGYVVTGGYVYRGSQQPGLQGFYFWADYATGLWWAIRPGNWYTVSLGQVLFGVSTFGEDAQGELYAADHSNGILYKIQGTLPAYFNHLPFVRK